MFNASFRSQSVFAELSMMPAAAADAAAATGGHFAIILAYARREAVN